MFLSRTLSAEQAAQFLTLDLDATEARRLIDEIRKATVVSLGSRDDVRFYDRQKTDDGRRMQFLGVYARWLLPIISPFGAASSTDTGGGIGGWQRLLLTLQGLIPGMSQAPLPLAEALLSIGSGGSSSFDFSPDGYDRISQRGALASFRAIERYVSEDAAESYARDQPVVRSRNLVTALKNLLSVKGWPSAGLVYITDLPSRSAALSSSGRPAAAGGWAKDHVIKPALRKGDTEEELRQWDREFDQVWESDGNPRHRGEQVVVAFRAILDSAAMLLEDPPRISVEEFMARSNFPDVKGTRDLNPSHIVCEAFGRSKMDEFDRLREEAGLMSDLYRASVVQVVMWKLALILIV